jgi:hypothetical protein
MPSNLLEKAENTSSRHWQRPLKQQSKCSKSEGFGIMAKNGRTPVRRSSLGRMDASSRRPPFWPIFFEKYFEEIRHFETEIDSLLGPVPKKIQ